ncbi:MAG TPA: MFS transporter, partial [Pyrinomonadaceae bacterium]|nr:MFS transporter [Pyrinomonadaceae bacterium]
MISLTYTQLLRGNRSFRRLWAGQVVSELGNWFNFIAGLGLVRAISSSAPEATGIMLLARLVPFALFAPFAGAFVDRFSRRTVMIVSDTARAVFALGFLLIGGVEDLWIAYTCSVVATLLAAFFEAAKNAAMPNITGGEGLLAGNALMFSSRFLLMSIGAALGGWASARFGYKAAFIINAASFIVSAYSIWLIPEEKMREEAIVEDDSEAESRGAKRRTSFWSDLQEGWKYIGRYPLVAAIIGLNVLWATGGGACNLIYDRLGGVVFAGQGMAADAGVAALYAAVGAGAFFGLLLARRVGAHVELHGATAKFIGWMMLAHGVVFAVGGLMPTLWLTGAMFFLSRFIIGMEFAVQETLMMRLLPDNLRGRVLTTDRAAEIFVLSISTVLATWSLRAISPRTLTILSGLLSAAPGLFWLALFASGRVRMPARIESVSETDED